MLPAGVEVTLEEIDDDMSGMALSVREGIAVKGDAFGGGQLDSDLIVFEPDRIVIRAGDLLAMRIVRRIAGGRVLLGAGFGADGAGVGHDEDIAEVGDAGAVEVVLGEAFYDAVGVVIAGAPVPSFVDVGGPDLDCAVGDTGAEEYVAVGGGADIGIYVGQWGGFFDGLSGPALSVGWLCGKCKNRKTGKKRKY